MQEVCGESLVFMKIDLNKAALFLQAWMKLRLRVYRETLYNSDSKERIGKMCLLRNKVLNL